jgi:S1-C subfamily serine protease
MSSYTFALSLIAVAADFIDAMDESNYVAVELSKPMGIVFEENDTEFGGIYVQSLKESGPATMSGLLKEGDQLVAVGTAKVSGMPFDDALAAIIESVGDQTKLVVFRGSAKQFYGPTGANREWVDEFVAKGGVPVSSA